MHDCRTNGGHFFVHRPQGHAFRCRRCSERFADSWSPTSTSPSSPSSPATPTAATTEQRKHPWRCIIERCEYVACDPCSSILMEELAAGGEGGGGGVGGADEKVAVGEEWGERERGGGGGMEAMEVDEEEEGDGEGEGGEGGEGARYVVSAVVCRTARQAAAEAAMKRAYVKRAPVRHGGRGE
ncbi:hypothetical protein DFP73DRAFT_631090 [Morchella snyderi]|nr:hypothetical protein DFP73DRAFT_631090 [Morchella snyderi]